MQNLLILNNDILTALDLQSASPEEKASRIIRRSTWDDLAENEKRICIYFGPSRNASNPIFSDEVLHFACHVPVSQDYIAWRVLSIIHGLLHEKEISNRLFLFDGQLGNLPSATGFFCAGIRYRFYVIK